MRAIAAVVIVVLVFIGGAYLYDELTFRGPAEVFGTEPGHSYVEAPWGEYVEVPSTWKSGDPVPWDR